MEKILNKKIRKDSVFSILIKFYEGVREIRVFKEISISVKKLVTVIIINYNNEL